MNLAQLVTAVRREVQTELPDAEIIEMLNEAQNQAALSLQVPTVELEVEGVNGPFDLSPALEAQGLKGAYNALLKAFDEHGREIDIMTTDEASRYAPWWRNPPTSHDYNHALFIIYDPANNTAPIYPVPNPDGCKLYLKVQGVPKDLEDFDSVPFNGELTGYHELLYHLVVARLLARNGDERSRLHFSRYDSLIAQAYSATRPASVKVTRSGYKWRSRRGY